MEYKIKVEHVSKAFKMYNSPMDKMKEALSLTKKTRHTVFYAIKDLSFQVEQGEILGIMGRNGSGKSTLLKMITGIYEPTEGNISVSGKISSLLELGTGFNMEYTGIENVFSMEHSWDLIGHRWKKNFQELLRLQRLVIIYISQ